MRVSQAWAGKNWGSIQIPRIGQEVIVSFLEGDPDRPIITGPTGGSREVGRIAPAALSAASAEHGPADNREAATRPTGGSRDVGRIAPAALSAASAEHGTPVTAVKGRCPRPLDEGDETFVGIRKTNRVFPAIWWS